MLPLPAFDDDDDYEDAQSLDAREYDDKDNFFIDDLNGVMALEGLDEVRSPLDPLHYCAGISGAHAPLYDLFVYPKFRHSHKVNAVRQQQRLASRWRYAYLVTFVIGTLVLQIAWTLWTSTERLSVGRLALRLFSRIGTLL